MVSRLFGRKAKTPTTPTPEAQYAPGTQVRYDPNLIKHFEGHHKTLLQLFGKITQATEQQNFAAISRHMEAFRKVLHLHLLEENVKLYSYLSSTLATDPYSSELANAMKREMGEIGMSVFRFIEHYTGSGVDSSSLATFHGQLDKIGSILVDRIEREESSLYGLYMPPAISS